MFRNLKLYRIPAGINATEGQIARNTFKPCAASDISSAGWVEPNAGSGLVHILNDQRLLCYQSEDKILPSSYVTRVTQARADQIEEEQGRKVGRKEMRELKELTIEALLPRAFTRLSRTFVWIDNANGYLAIDASSDNRCDDVLELLNRSLDMIPQVARIQTAESPTSCMAEWLTGDAPAGFSIDRDCELRDATEEHGSVRYNNTSLDTEEVRNQIGSGKVPTRIGMTWNDRISFVLTPTMNLKRIQMLDVLTEQTTEDEEDIFASDFALFTGELSKLIADVIDACGGEMPDIDAQEERKAA